MGSFGKNSKNRPSAGHSNAMVREQDSNTVLCTGTETCFTLKLTTVSFSTCPEPGPR